MHNLFKNLEIKTIIICYALFCIIGFTLRFGYTLTLSLSGFFLLAIIAISRQSDISDLQNLTRLSRSSKSLLLMSITYPIAELIIKMFVVCNVIPYSWAWFNRLEHILFTIFVSYFIFIIIKSHNITTNKFATAFFAFFIINTLGIINEFVEFGIRLYLLDTNRMKILPKWGTYYTDTIFDMLTNFISASILICCIFIFYGYKRSISNK